jgi:hypothetical protein
MEKKYLVIRNANQYEDFTARVVAEFAQLSEAYGYVIKNGMASLYVAKIVEPKVVEK